MRRSGAFRAAACAFAVAVIAIVSLPQMGCGGSDLDPAAAKANQDEQALLQQKIQKGIAKGPATKRK